MIRLANAGVDYWISPTFSFNTGFQTLTLNHNKGKYVKAGKIYYPGTASIPRMVHDIFSRDASGAGNDYGSQMSNGPATHTLNSITLGLFNPYADVSQTDCVVYLEFLEATLPN